MAILLGGLVNPAWSADTVDFSLPGVDGKNYQLSDYRGKWVLINYWATWCPPCLEELPDLEIFHNNHHKDKAVVLGINSEDISEKKLKTFLESQFLSFPILRMKPSDKTPFGRISALPTSFLISPKGEVVAKQVGKVTGKAIEAFIKDFENDPKNKL